MMKDSTPHRRASLKLGLPAGITIKFLQVDIIFGMLPPFKIFIIGTGSMVALTPPTYLYSGRSQESAAALQTARDTPRIALAPRLPLSSVPSR